MADDVEQSGNDDKPVFEVEDGEVWARVGPQRFWLGRREAVHEAMADHLAAEDFGE